jgi:hypothetical protein
MVAEEQESRFTEHVHVCGTWSEIRDQFDRIPIRELTTDEEGQTHRKGWIFRGHKRACYPLKPSIEREYADDWDDAEYKALREFQSKARMHMDPGQLPKAKDKLGWLAIMHHYGAPTRLLDFTYSPYVALYFALRNRRKNESAFAEVWALDAVALQSRATDTSLEADKRVREHARLPTPRGGRVSMALEDMSSPLQRSQEDDNDWDESLRKALNPCGTRREHFNNKGFVAEALPTNHNPRRGNRAYFSSTVQRAERLSIPWN